MNNKRSRGKVTTADEKEINYIIIVVVVIVVCMLARGGVMYEKTIDYERYFGGWSVLLINKTVEKLSRKILRPPSTTMTTTTF